MATLEEEAQKLLNEDEFNAVFRHIKTVMIWNRSFLMKNLKLFDPFIINDCSLVEHLVNAVF